ncbi:MAG: N-acetylmuramoyl-L-alanine amidase family protein [Eubacteriales bacterium]
MSNQAIKVYIDQGHNPVNPNAGAEAFGLREQDINYTVGVLCAELFNANPAFEARLSRPTRQTQLGTSIASSLRIRVDAANSWGADYFISIHCNASSIESASGSEAFVYRLNSPAYELAEDILRRMNETTGLQNRGVFARPTLYVLRTTRMPAVLVEMGFLTNPEDAALLSTQPDLFAQGIYQGTVDYVNRA